MYASLRVFAASKAACRSYVGHTLPPYIDFDSRAMTALAFDFPAYKRF
jgi:hypothetical protein